MFLPKKMQTNYSDKNAENGKILQFDNSVGRYFSLTEKRMENGDFLAALDFAFSGLRAGGGYDSLADIADIYADMEQYELSNYYWMKYLTVAPTDKTSVAYEELAINYFYMNNPGLAGYYFHKKITTDGFINKDGLDEDILNFIAEKTNNQNYYYVAYPFDRADYSLFLKEGKDYLASGEPAAALKVLSRIPQGCKQYKEGNFNKAIAHFLSGETDEAIDLLREAVKADGGDVNTLCNLSSMYDFKNDKDKSRYYYSLALERPATDPEAFFKLATCSLEQKEHLKGAEFFGKAIDKNFYDPKILFLYGLALLNSRNYEKAAEVLALTYRIDPRDDVTRYYVKLSQKIVADPRVADAFLPLEYAHVLPAEERTKRRRKINTILSYNSYKFNLEMKKAETQELYKWALSDCSGKVLTECLEMLFNVPVKTLRLITSDWLLDGDFPPKIKESLMFIMIISGYRGKISLYTGQIFLSFTVKKSPCEKYENLIYFAAYARALTRVAFTGEPEIDKLVFSLNKIYKALKGDEIEKTLDRELLAALITLEAKLLLVNSTDNVAKLFAVDRKELKTLSEYYRSKGVLNGKNNRRRRTVR